MAVGDVVNAIGANNAILDFQPAVGVECVITMTSGGNTTVIGQLYNGTLTATSVSQYTLGAYTGMQNIKLFINNTTYLRIVAGGAGQFNSYCGMQIK